MGFDHGSVPIDGHTLVVNTSGLIEVNRSLLEKVDLINGTGSLIGVFGTTSNINLYSHVISGGKFDNLIKINGLVSYDYNTNGTYSATDPTVYVQLTDGTTTVTRTIDFSETRVGKETDGFIFMPNNSFDVIIDKNELDFSKDITMTIIHRFSAVTNGGGSYRNFIRAKSSSVYILGV